MKCGSLPFKPAHQTSPRTSARRSFILLAIAVCWLGLVASANAERSVTLAWNPSADSSTTGYRIYASEENAATSTRINVLGLTQVTIPGLKEGLRYTFKVTAYNALGIESGPSNDAVFVVPVPLQLLPGTIATDVKRLQFPMAPGHWYELQASTDMKTWTTIWQTGVASSYVWTEFQDALSGFGVVKTSSFKPLPTRFYRLQVH